MKKMLQDYLEIRVTKFVSEIRKDITVAIKTQKIRKMLQGYGNIIVITMCLRNSERKETRK